MSTDALPRHRQLGLTDWEADEIPRLLGREPTDPELVMFSLMWSEHCSYKHSKPLLRAFPTDGPGILQGPGENAGAIDVGDGLAVAFKIESHNHPSAVEPFEGAATGVGGIVRDIIAMGAQPIALLDSLRFGALTSAAAATCSGARSPASATTATASACRPLAARWASTTATRTRASSTPCASGSPARRHPARRRQGHRQPARADRQPHRPRRHRRRERAGVGGAVRRRGQAARRCR